MSLIVFVTPNNTCPVKILMQSYEMLPFSQCDDLQMTKLFMETQAPFCNPDLIFTLLFLRSQFKSHVAILA